MANTATRVRHLLAANLHGLFDKAEDPAKMLAAILREMDELESSLAAEIVPLQARIRQQEEQQRTLERRLAACQGRAEEAYAAGEEDRAREALARRFDAQQALAANEKDLAELRSALSRIHADLERLASRRRDAEAQRRDVVRQRQRTQIEYRYASSADACLARNAARIGRIESRIEHLEARVEVHDLAPPPPPSDAEAAIEAELDAMKQRLAAGCRT